jgi:hypothetical protein
MPMSDARAGQSDPTQQIAELPRASLGYKQPNKTIRTAKLDDFASTQLEVNFYASGMPHPLTEH